MSIVRNFASSPAAIAPAAEIRESRPPERLIVGATSQTSPIDRASATDCPAAALARSASEARLGPTSCSIAPVSVWLTVAHDGLSSTVIAEPGRTFAAPRTGVFVPRNHPAAAWIAHPSGSSSGPMPAKSGSAPNRFDHTQPEGVRSS